MAALLLPCRRLGYRLFTLTTSRSFAKVAPSSEYILLSEACTKQILKVCSDGGSGTGTAEALRLTVDGGGCSGFQYKFSVDSVPDDGPSSSSDDVLIVDPRSGARMIVDVQSLDFVRGATVDYHSELIRSAFRVVKNPKAEQGCSCGASFSLKADGLPTS